MKLIEERSTKMMDLITELKKLEFVEKLLDVKAMHDGFTVFFRGSDGNAYELEIRPATYAKGHEELRKPEKYIERRRKKMDSIRQNFNL
jgi:hypothetical protein